MEKQYYILFTILFTTTVVAHGHPRFTNLVLYMHEIRSGSSPTLVKVISANSTATSPTMFGLIAIIDNPMRAGISPNSTLVAYGQGIVALDSKERASAHETIDIVFINNTYSGSSLTTVGQNPYLLPYREVPIVGGTKIFRLACGFIEVTTEYRNNATGDSIYRYNMHIYHY